jgi:hypothetical protein
MVFLRFFHYIIKKIRHFFAKIKARKLAKTMKEK